MGGKKRSTLFKEEITKREKNNEQVKLDQKGKKLRSD